ncbi:MAG: DUF2089 domain-containing protein [Anaerolineae bacterium]|nr:DUF2089 domain-containing protein [Anaerolineae bacterium]
MYAVPSECPVCHDDLLVTQLVCRNCGTELRNRFEMDALSRLIPEQRHFVEVFLLCEGKLNCVQDELGISYPTVRSRLDEIIRALRQKSPAQERFVEESTEDQGILDRLARQEITAEEALRYFEEK